jgi:NhaP-type Na+/H+ or K+/H+ antiporter
MSMVTWLIFGGVVIKAMAPQFTWQVLLYSILSLTVVRMVPVALVLMETKTSLKNVLFMGWFGPRGLASIVFAIIILDVELPHKDRIILTAVCTILLSIVLHGLTANPFIKLISNTKTKGK